MTADLLPFLSAIVVGLIAAFVNRRGQKAETSIEQIKVLVTGQQERITQLTQDLAKTNERLDKAQGTIEDEVTRGRRRWDLASESIGYLRKWDYWYHEGKRDPAPDVPLDQLRKRLWET